MTRRKFISIGKGRKKRSFPLNKKKGVSVRSVSLQPKAEMIINKKQIQLINQGKPATFSKALNQVILRKKKDVPVYDTHVNVNDRRKPYLMHVTDMKKHKKVKGSDTIVMADSYGQAVDDFITVWNKDPERKKMQIGYPVVQGTSMKGFRYKRDEISSIRDLNGRDDFDLVQVDTDIEFFLDYFGLPKDEYDGLFIKQKDGEVVEAYGFSGIVPDLNKSVDRIETPEEKLEKKFGTRKARLVDTIKHGDRVTIVTSRGQKLTGKAVMKSSLGDNNWVLNTGGAHGTPALASDENVVKVVEGR